MSDTDERLSHESIERYVDELPREIIGRLPDGIEKKSALRNLDIVVDYAHQSLEKAPRE